MDQQLFNPMNHFCDAYMHDYMWKSMILSFIIVRRIFMAEASFVMDIFARKFPLLFLCHV